MLVSQTNRIRYVLKFSAYSSLAFHENIQHWHTSLSLVYIFSFTAARVAILKLADGLFICTETSTS